MGGSYNVFIIALPKQDLFRLHQLCKDNQKMVNVLIQSTKISNKSLDTFQIIDAYREDMVS